MVLLSLLGESPVDALPLTWGMLAVIGSVAAGTAFLTWFVRDQFSNQRRAFFRIISKHNREDDDRFASLSDDIWNIREQVGNGPLPPRKTLPRRRYLIDDDGNGEEAEASRP